MHSQKVALLTMRDTQGFVTDDQLVLGPLAKHGIIGEFVPWDNNQVEWTKFDMVIVRSTWDYQIRFFEYIKTLEILERSVGKLQNDIRTIKWNAEKTYLVDIMNKGFSVIPSVFLLADITAAHITTYFKYFNTRDLILKPVIGANADGIIRLQDKATATPEQMIAINHQPYIIQPFIPTVQKTGEVSLVYFLGDFSHAIQKIPAKDDFRSQEEHGATILAYTPKREFILFGKNLLASISPTPLYARVDMVFRRSGEPLLMELELIEPSLYLRTDQAAPEKFAAAIKSNLHG